MTTGRDIARALRRAYLTMHRQTPALLAAYDLTPVQYVLVALLASEDGVTEQKLTRRASSDPSTVRATLLLLERGGMICRRSDQTDRRAKQFHLTARGRRTNLKLSAAPKLLQGALLAPFSAAEAEALAAQLQRAAEAMRTWEVHQ